MLLTVSFGASGFCDRLRDRTRICTEGQEGFYMPLHVRSHVEVDDGFLKDFDDRAKGGELGRRSTDLVQEKVCNEGLSDTLFLHVERLKGGRGQLSQPFGHGHVFRE